MSDIKIQDEQGNIVEQEAQTAGDPVATIPEGTLLAERVAQMFDLKPSEVSKYKRKLNTLIEYAKTKTDDHSPQGLKWAIRSLGTKLGTPPLGEKLLPYLTRYAHLSLESNRIEAEKQKFEKGYDGD